MFFATELDKMCDYVYFFHLFRRESIISLWAPQKEMEKQLNDISCGVGND